MVPQYNLQYLMSLDEGAFHVKQYKFIVHWFSRLYFMGFFIA